MILVTVTENHILESALYKAMILQTFLGIEKNDLEQTFYV